MTTLQIVDLRAEAMQARDFAQAIICDIALHGASELGECGLTRAQAVEACAEVYAEARAQQECPFPQDR